MNELLHFIKGLQHIGIPTLSMEKSIDFYQKIGFSILWNTQLEASNEKVVFIKLGNLVIELYESKEATMKTGSIDHIALNVIEIDRLFNYIKEQNLTILDDSVQSLPFWDKGVKFFTILGPNSEKIEFCEKLI